MKYNIPKLARNQYNYVKGLDGENYVTQSQMMMSNGGSGGSGGSINSNTFSQNDQLQSAIKKNCDIVQDACYAYTYSRTSDTMNYNDIDTLVRSIIADMKASYDLVGGSYVISECADVKASCYAYTDSKIV